MEDSGGSGVEDLHDVCECKLSVSEEELKSGYWNLF